MFEWLKIGANDSQIKKKKKTENEPILQDISYVLQLGYEQNSAVISDTM